MARNVLGEQLEPCSFDPRTGWLTATCSGPSSTESTEGTSAVFDFNGAWLLLVTCGEPIADKRPGTELRLELSEGPVWRGGSGQLGDR